MSAEKFLQWSYFWRNRRISFRRPVSKIDEKIINYLTENPDSEIQILTNLFQILSYKLTEYVKPRIMINSELHNHFPPINATALLSFLKKAVQVLLPLSE